MPDSKDKMVETDALSAAIPFQFDDVKELAQRILRRAAAQAQRKLDAAAKQAADIEKAGFDDGHAKGYDEGYKKGEAEGRAAGEAAAREAFEERTQTLAPLLQRLLEEVEARRQTLRAEAEADLLRLSLAIAEKIVRREVRVDEAYILPTLRAAVGVSLERSDLLLRVHPADVEAVEAELPALRSAFTDLERIRVEADATMERGGLRVVGRRSEVDMRLDEQMNAFERALLGLAPDGEETGDASSAALPPPGTGGEEPPAALTAPEAGGSESPAPQTPPETDSSANTEEAP